VPLHLHLRDPLLYGETGPEETVLIRPALPLASMEAKPVQGFQAFVRIGPQGYTLHVRPEASLPLGYFRRMVNLQLTGQHGEVLPEQQVQVTGTVTGPFVCIPEAINFGTRRLGTQAKEIIQIKGRRAGVIREVTPIPEGTGVILTRIQNWDDEGVGFRLTQRIEREGGQRISIKWLVQDEAGQQSTVPLILDYYGTTAR
jgi:hypothetical protein